MAGTWSSLASSRGAINGAPSPVHERSKSFIADSADGGVPDTEFIGVSGFLTGARVAFDTTTYPDSATILINDKNGITLTSGTFTASGLFEIASPIPFSDGLSISVSGNTTNSAKATVYVYVI